MVDICLLHRYQLHVSARIAIFSLMNLQKKYISSYIWHASFMRRRAGEVIGWGYEISCVLGRKGRGVYMGVYYANLS